MLIFIKSYAKIVVTLYLWTIYLKPLVRLRYANCSLSLVTLNHLMLCLAYTLKPNTMPPMRSLGPNFAVSIYR